jgi:hypothetical protein
MFTTSGGFGTSGSGGCSIMSFQFATGAPFLAQISIFYDT